MKIEKLIILQINSEPSGDNKQSLCGIMRGGEGINEFLKSLDAAANCADIDAKFREFPNAKESISRSDLSLIRRLCSL